MTPPDYEAFFRISQRPFSLTPDPKFYFRSRSHGRVFDTLSTAIARRDTLMLVIGDLGVGKTTLCRTLMESPGRKSRSALVGNALLSPEDLLRLMLQDLGAIAKGDARQGTLGHATRADLVQQFDQFLAELHEANDTALMIIDEAHSLPPATMEQIVEIASLGSNRHKVLQFLLAGQPTAGGGGTLPRVVDERLTVRARLLPLERDESERYVHHRLTIAGGAAVTFSAPAIESDLRAVGRRAETGQPALRARAPGGGRGARQPHRTRDDRIVRIGARPVEDPSETLPLVRHATDSSSIRLKADTTNRVGTAVGTPWRADFSRTRQETYTAVHVRAGVC